MKHSWRLPALSRPRWMASILFLTMTVCLACIPPDAPAGNLNPPSVYAPSSYVVEDLEANVHSDGNVLIVTGRIKNLTPKKMWGRIIVYLKTEKNDTLGTIDTEIKDTFIAPGGSGRFEVAADVRGLGGLRNVSVEFLEH